MMLWRCDLNRGEVLGGKFGDIFSEMNFVSYKNIGDVESDPNIISESLDYQIRNIATMLDKDHVIVFNRYCNKGIVLLKTVMAHMYTEHIYHSCICTIIGFNSVPEEYKDRIYKFDMNVNLNDDYTDFRYENSFKSCDFISGKKITTMFTKVSDMNAWRKSCS